MSDSTLEAARVRAAVFRQTFFGYRQDDVDRALARYADGLEGGSPPPPPSGRHLFARGIRGYHVREVEQFVEHWRRAAWGGTTDAQGAWPVVTAGGLGALATSKVAAGSPNPPQRSRPPAAQFWLAAVALAALLAGLPVLLVLWSAFFGRTDGARQAQIVWAVVIVLLGAAGAAVAGYRGTFALTIKVHPRPRSANHQRSRAADYPPPVASTIAAQPPPGWAPPPRPTTADASVWAVQDAVGPGADRGAFAPPLQGGELEAAVAGRATQAEGFWPFFILLSALVLAMPCFLVAWGALAGASDLARSAQVEWGLGLLVAFVIVLARLCRTGTTVTPDGLTRHFLFHRRRLAWSDLNQFGPGPRGLPGLWLSRASGRPLQVPSALHSCSRQEATDTARFINDELGLRAFDVDVAVRPGRNVLVVWAGWSWPVTLFTAGIAAPLVYLVGARLTRRRWLWLLAAAFTDATVFGVAFTYSPSSTPETASLVVFASSTLILLVTWLGGWRGRNTWTAWKEPAARTAGQLKAGVPLGGGRPRG